MSFAYPLAGIVATAALLVHAPASACSCSANGAAGVWPRDGSMEVPIDTPFVVAATDLAHVTPELIAEDGTPVALQERRRLVPPGAFSCLKYSYVFLTVAADLAPNQRYVLMTHVDGPEGEASETASVEHSLSFVTGSGTRDPVVPGVQLSLFGVPLGPQWGARAGTLLEVYVETDAVEPLFVLATGERDVLVHDLDPIQTERPFRVGFGSVECSALTIVDVSGTTLLDPVLCEPSKCTLVDSIGESSCGGESFPGLDWNTWQRVPEGCDREALLRDAGNGSDITNDVMSGDAPPSQLEVPASRWQMPGGTTPNSAPAEAGAAQASPTTGGCGLSPQGQPGIIFAVASLLAALMKARASRRST